MVFQKNNIPWNKGIPATLESKKHHSECMKGRKQTKENIEKRRQSNIGKHSHPQSKEMKEKNRLAHIGKKQSSESIQKRILTRKNANHIKWHQTDIAKEKIRTARAKQIFSKETIEKRRVKMKELWANPNSKLNSIDRSKLISLSKKGKKRFPFSGECKRKMREHAIRRIEKQKLNGQLLTPCIGEKEKPILDYVEKMLNIKIERQYKIRGFFLDGYCKEKNLVFEIDESHHFNIDGKLVEGDVRRQHEIQNELNCNFIRIKENFVRFVE